MRYLWRVRRGPLPLSRPPLSFSISLSLSLSGARRKKKEREPPAIESLCEASFFFIPVHNSRTTVRLPCTHSPGKEERSRRGFVSSPVKREIEFRVSHSFNFAVKECGGEVLLYLLKKVSPQDGRRAAEKVKGERR